MASKTNTNAAPSNLPTSRNPNSSADCKDFHSLEASKAFTRSRDRDALKGNMLSNRLSLRATDGRHSKKKGKSVVATPFIKNPEEGGEEQRVVNPIQLKLLKE